MSTMQKSSVTQDGVGPTAATGTTNAEALCAMEAKASRESPRVIHKGVVAVLGRNDDIWCKVDGVGNVRFDDGWLMLCDCEHCDGSSPICPMKPVDERLRLCAEAAYMMLVERKDLPMRQLSGAGSASAPAVRDNCPRIDTVGGALALACLHLGDFPRLCALALSDPSAYAELEKFARKTVKSFAEVFQSADPITPWPVLRDAYREVVESTPLFMAAIRRGLECITEKPVFTMGEVELLVNACMGSALFIGGISDRWQDLRQSVNGYCVDDDMTGKVHSYEEVKRTLNQKLDAVDCFGRLHVIDALTQVCVSGADHNAVFTIEE